MKSFLKKTSNHLQDVNQSYLQHMFFTFSVAASLLVTAACIMIHGIFPGILQDTASKKINILYEKFINRFPNKFKY